VKRWSASLALLVSFTLSACSGLATRSDVRPVQVNNQPSSETLYVVRRGWHIDVGFDAAELVSPLSALLTQLPGAHFVSIGFGDRHYLVAKHKSFPGLLAAVWPGDGLILATGITNSPVAAFGTGHVIAIKLTDAQLTAAQRFVWESILQRDGTPQVVSPGPYGGSIYLGSTRTYSAANTCNTWAAEVLESAGLPVRSAGVIFAGQLWRQARSIDRGTLVVH
jgi:hypothetical protein